MIWKHFFVFSVLLKYYLNAFLLHSDFQEFGNGIQPGDSSLYVNGMEISIEDLNAFKYVFFYIKRLLFLCNYILQLFCLFCKSVPIYFLDR